MALVVSRQNVPTLDRSRCAPAAGLARGAYVLCDADGGKPDVLLIGTGSEVAMCLAAHEQLTREGIASRVVSMPSWEIFERQDREYRESVLLPETKARVSVEKASTLGWDRYVGTEGASIGMTTFGASAPLAKLQKRFGFTVENVVSAARKQVETHGRGASRA